MKELTLASHETNVTMSSREIAELTGKEHKHVVRDIEKMLSDLNIYSPNMDFNDFKGFLYIVVLIEVVKLLNQST